ncbi:3713_t:CDS:2, partial [Racocetra persica]
LEFWTCAEDPSSDRALILYLYTKNLLNSIPYDPLEAELLVKNQNLQNKIDQFWGCFNPSIKINNRGINARKYSRINGPGCIAINKPIVTQNQISEIKNREFEVFFADKDNVFMSSYKVHSKTNLPILYLKDNKEALWKKYEAIYSDRIK